MRTRTRWATSAVALPVAAALAACGVDVTTAEPPRTAEQEANTDRVCLEAINAASFMPNFADPQQAKVDARARVDEIAQLTDRTADSALRQDLINVRSSVQQVASGRVSLDTSSDWTSGQAETYQDVTTTCSEATSSDSPVS